MRSRIVGVFVVAVMAAAGWSAYRVVACPFCAAVALTFTEEMQNTDVAILAKLIEAPPRVESVDGGFLDITNERSQAKFEITEVLKGDKFLAPNQIISTLFIGEAKPGQVFLITGIEPPNVTWATPIALSERATEYVRRLPGLADKDQVERLGFFLNYLEDQDEMLARDSYDEFAKVPFNQVALLETALNHDRLVGWIKDPKVPASRRRLYLTLLGICGRPDDIPMLEESMRDPSQQALDATINAYLMLKGADGLQLVEDLFLKNKDAEYTRTYSAIVALRVHGQEVKTIPRERLVAALRHMLDRPDLADLVIPDLARWEDWGSTDKLVELFKTADDSSSWVRTPVINFLRASPEPRAKELLAELAQIDPKAVERANAFALPVAPAPPPSSPPSSAPATNSEAPPTATVGNAADTEQLKEQPEPDQVSEEPTAASGEQPASPAKDVAKAGADTANRALESAVTTLNPEVADAPAGESSDDEPSQSAGDLEKSPPEIAAVAPLPTGESAPANNQKAETSAEARPTMSLMVWVVAVPIVAVAALVGLIWSILGGSKGRRSA